jgi:hypothetical protein
VKRLRAFSLILFLALIMAACGSPATSLAPSPTSKPALPEETTTPPKPTTPAPVFTPTQSASPTPEGAWIQLVPDKAAPGAMIKIEGYLPGGPTQAEAQKDQSLNQTTVCWQGCLNGLTEQAQPVTWSATDPGHFEASFIVPAIPWLSSKGPQALEPGDYTIGLQCLGPELQGCALKEAQASATFHLEGPVPQMCQAGQPCASLTFAPAEASPGTTVQVQGWAPLVGMINGQAFGYSLVLEPESANSMPMQVGQVQQSLDGKLSSSFEVPQQLPSQGVLQPGPYTVALQAIRPSATKGTQPPLVAATTFTITGSLSWNSLPVGQPLWIQPSANLTAADVTVDPGNPNRIAYCAPGEIKVSQDSGKTWSSISTAAVASAADSSGYPLMSQNQSNQATCLAVTLDTTHPDSYYAVFQTMDKQYGAPPVFFMGYFTHDAGKTWAQAPVPAKLTAENFGGFWSNGQGIVQALYSGSAQGPDQAPPVSVEQTSDGGQNWSTGELICPNSGPCIRWGPAPGSIPGMGSPLPQFIYISTDGGKTWNSPGISVELRTQGPHELVALSDQVAVVLSGSGDYPVQVTQDGGKTWQAASLPSLPQPDDGGPLFPGLQSLPDGSLLAQPFNTNGFMLTPGSTAWCSLGSTNLSSTTVLLQASGQELFWLTPDSGKLESIPVAGLKCSP